MSKSLAIVITLLGAGIIAAGIIGWCLHHYEWHLHIHGSANCKAAAEKEVPRRKR